MHSQGLRRAIVPWSGPGEGRLSTPDAMEIRQGRTAPHAVKSALPRPVAGRSRDQAGGPGNCFPITFSFEVQYQGYGPKAPSRPRNCALGERERSDA